jgi:hypothetical protein
VRAFPGIDTKEKTMQSQTNSVAGSRARARRLAWLAAPAAALVLGLAVPAAERPAPALPPRGSAYKAAVLAKHPVAYWRLDEKAGSHHAADSSGHRHTGKYHGKPHLGQPGALALDRDLAIGLPGPKTRSYVEVPSSRAFSLHTSRKGLSVEVWLRPDTLTFRGENPDPKDPYIHWLGKGERGEYEWGFRFYSRNAKHRPNRISAYVWNADGAKGAGAYFQDPLKKGEWLHVVATFDPPTAKKAQVRIYKNGQPSKHNGSSGTLYSSYSIVPKAGKAPVRLGTRDLRAFLKGGLDEVAIYPRVLTPAEVLEHYRVGKGLVRKHPLADKDR